jgi:hypothetical protein
MTVGLRGASAWVLGVLALAWAAPASAVIKVDFPVSKIYGDSKTVIAGTVARLNPDNRVIDIKVQTVMKGEPVGEQVRVQIAAPPELIKQVAPEQPVVVFAGEVEAVVHLADTWLLAKRLPMGGPPAWRVESVYATARTTFPGRTAGLIGLVAQLKAGGPKLMDVADAEAFGGGAKELAHLKVKPTFLAAADLNADRKLDLIVGTAGGVKLFLAADKSYTDVTDQWRLTGAAGNHCAVGDVNGDGKPDLLLGKTLWLRSDDAFVQAKATLDLPPESDWLAVTLADATGQKRSDVVVLLKNGKLITLANPGSLDKPWPATSKTLWEDPEVPQAAAFSADWGDNGELHVLVVREKDIVRYACGPTPEPPADFLRLTGVPLSSDKGIGDKPMKVVLATPLDYDGNGKTDYLLVTEGGGITLVNRGFGSFLTSAIQQIFHVKGEDKLPFALTPATAVAPGAIAAGKNPRQNLLILTEEGKLFELDNSEK